MGHVDLLVVGAGICGATAARYVAEAGMKVMVVEKQAEVAGHIQDRLDASGIMVQTYGPHIFHTENPAVWDFLSRFCQWNSYQHRVLAWVNRQFVPFPICITTLERLFKRPFDEASMRAYIAAESIPLKQIDNSRDVVLSQVGERFYQLFVENYTRKQWGIGADELDSAVLKRIPLRFNREERYFTDTHQGLPQAGFTQLIRTLLDHPGITLNLGTNFEAVKKQVKRDLTLYTGRLDEFFDFRLGVLPYRSLRFRLLNIDRPKLLPAGVVNFPGPEPFTRISEYKTFYQQEDIKRTVVAIEYPQAEGEPFYPIPGLKNRELVERYRLLAAAEPDVLFAGRLGGYRYLNMDQASAEGLERGGEVVKWLRRLDV